MENNRKFSIHKEHEQQIITACVGFVSPSDKLDSFVAVRNKRGWDIPGGHIQATETPSNAFIREVLEETGCRVINEPIQIAFLENEGNHITGIMAYSAICKLESFSPTDEIFERAVFTREELLEKYFDDKETLQELLDITVQRRVE